MQIDTLDSGWCAVQRILSAFELFCIFLHWRCLFPLLPTSQRLTQGLWLPLGPGSILWTRACFPYRRTLGNRWLLFPAAGHSDSTVGFYPPGLAARRTATNLKLPRSVCFRTDTPYGVSIWIAYSILYPIKKQQTKFE